jgi:hypothetical protein
VLFHMEHLYILTLLQFCGCRISNENCSTFQGKACRYGFFLHEYNNIISSLCNYMLTKPSSTDPPTYTTEKSFIPSSGAVSFCQEYWHQKRTMIPGKW